MLAIFTLCDLTFYPMALDFTDFNFKLFEFLSTIIALIKLDHVFFQECCDSLPTKIIPHAALLYLYCHCNAC